MVQQRTELLTPYGRVEIIALRSGDGPRSTVLVNVGCYYTLADAGARDLQVVYFRLVLVLEFRFVLFVCVDILGVDLLDLERFDIGLMKNRSMGSLDVFCGVV